MKITPKTDAELKASNLLPAGKYPFEISGAIDAVSKTSGLPMIKLTVRAFDDENKIHLMTDYLSSSEKAAFKVKNVCKACGLLEQYEAGDVLPDMFIGKTGYLNIIVEEDDTYGTQNKIKDYVVSEEPFKTNKVANKNKLAEVLEGDDIPF